MMAKRILYISNTNPYSNKFGAEQRSNIILRALVKAGYKLDVVYIGITPCIPPTDTFGCNIIFWNSSGNLECRGVDRLKYLSTFTPYPTFRNLSVPIRKIILKNDYDYIVCRYLQSVYSCGITQFMPKLIIDLDDYPVDSLKSFLPKNTDYIHRLYHRLILNSVTRATSWCRKKTLVAYLANKEDSDKYGFSYLPNISLYNCDKAEHLKGCKNVLFIGKLDYQPNIEGLDRFLANVWTNVVKHHPDSRFLIGGIGLNENTKARWASFPNVNILGFVDNIHEFYNSANIAVCPIYSGSGTNIKSIESLSLGKATVMTEFSAKGVSDALKNYENSIIAKTDDDMTEALDRLLSDDELCKKLQTNGHTLAKKLFSIDAIAEILVTVIGEEK